MESNKLFFSVKAGIKNIVGKDLIADDNIAIFELVKNSYDAYASKVIITFEDDKILQDENSIYCKEIFEFKKKIDKIKNK